MYDSTGDDRFVTLQIQIQMSIRMRIKVKIRIQICRHHDSDTTHGDRNCMTETTSVVTGFKIHNTQAGIIWLVVITEQYLDVKERILQKICHATNTNYCISTQIFLTKMFLITILMFSPWRQGIQIKTSPSKEVEYLGWMMLTAEVGNRSKWEE